MYGTKRATESFGQVVGHCIRMTTDVRPAAAWDERMRPRGSPTGSGSWKEGGLPDPQWSEARRLSLTAGHCRARATEERRGCIGLLAALHQTAFDVLRRRTSAQVALPDVPRATAEADRTWRTASSRSPAVTSQRVGRGWLARGPIRMVRRPA